MTDRNDTDSGRVVGRFRLHEVIGRGGAGVVHRATDSDGRPAAVKILLRVGPVDSNTLRRFEREARIRIRHPNICGVLDAGAAADGTPYIAFDLLEGENLEARLKRGPLPAAAAADIGIQVCRGLAAAHAAEVIHRDLKPSNLFICSDGTVKVIDFGIARWRGPEATQTTGTGRIVGTPSYLSPEQARGEGEVDARTDIWSLGAVLYEALSGRAPFARDTALAGIVAVVMDEPVPLSARAPDVPPGLAAVVERALRKPREERWPSAEAFAEALRRADLSAAPSSARSAAAKSQRSIAPGEQRVVAVLLVEGVEDAGAVERAVRLRGGSFMPLLGRRVLGVFGGKVSEGDELRRAVFAAAQSRTAAARMAVASGRAEESTTGISGAVLRAAEEGCAAELDGVAIVGEAARGLTSAFTVGVVALREVGRGLCELAVDRPPVGTASRPPDDFPTLGRRGELAQLRLAVETVLAERRAIVLLVTGPPGIGKSRLRRELQRMLEAAEPAGRMLLARAEPLGRGVSFSLIASALQARARDGAILHGWPQLDEGRPVGERREAVLRLTEEATGDVGLAHEWAAVLGEVLGVSMADERTGRSVFRDPAEARDRVRTALQGYFSGLCHHDALALLLENLQWADEASLEIVDDLLGRLADRSFLVFAAARPELDEMRPDLFAGREVIRIRPRGLLPADVGRLAASIAGRPLPEPLVQAIADRTAGNPLFVREIVQELVDRGLSDGTVESLPLPLTVEAAVQSRLDHLLPAEKDLCKRAAVFARPFTAEELAALGLGSTEAHALLGCLARRGIVAAIARPRGATESRYRFTSALLADVAYRMLGDDLRRELHRSIASFLGGARPSDAEEIAFHLVRGGERAEAAPWHAAAALAAAARGDSPSVVRCAKHALEFGVPPERRFALHQACEEALGFLGRRDEQMLELARAFECAPGDGERAGVQVKQAAFLWQTGKVPEALDAVEAAIATARRAGDREVLTMARGWQAAMLGSAGRIAEATSALREGTDLALLAPPQTRAFLATQRAALAAATGDLADRREALRAAVTLYQEAGDVRGAAAAEASLAEVHNRVGAYAEAIGPLRSAVEACKRVGHRAGEGLALCSLAHSLAALGRADEALAALDQATVLATATRDARLAVKVGVCRARALLVAHAPFTAGDEAQRALDRAERLGAAELSLAALSMAAQACLAAHDPAGALVRSTRAMLLLERFGIAVDDEAEVILAHAQALAGCGRHGEAREVLARARDRVQDIAGRITDPGLRLRFLRDVHAHHALMDTAGT